MNDRIFAALGDPTRQTIVARLAAHGPATTLALLEGLAGTRQGNSRHLRVLEDAGLVVSERSGREIVRSLNTTALRGSRLWLDELERAWDSRFEQLQASYEGEGRP